MIINGDCLIELKKLESNSIQTCVTSPPYWGLRDYGVDGQLGLEKTPEEFVAKLVEIFSEVRRVLKDDGTLWLNLGDSYAASGKSSPHSGLANAGATSPSAMRETLEELAKHYPKRNFPSGLKQKDLVGIPWRVAFALQAAGWYLRQDIIWHKPNPMPESVTDRCTKAHEYIFLLSKSAKYYFDHEAIKEPATYKDGPRNKGPHKKFETDFTAKEYSRTRQGVHLIGPRETRNKRSVWTVTTKPFKGAHFATFPLDLIEPCILAGAPKGGVVLDPFAGAGTTGVASKKHGREFLGIELNPDYAKLAHDRIENYQIDVVETQLELPVET